MYTIKRAAELSGVPAATLRAWERRYGLVEPERTDAGYRLYDDDAVGRVRDMAALVADGWSASTAAAEVSRRRDASTASTPAVTPATPGRVPTAHPAPAPTPAVGADMARRLIDAASVMDATGVARVLDERFALGSFESVVDEWLLPTLDEVGNGWADQRISIAGEHLVAHAVLRRLAAAYEAAASRPGGPTVVVGLPGGAHHELGIFAFAVALRRRGVDVVYLGPNLPAPAWRAALESHTSRIAVLAVPQRRDLKAACDVVDALQDADSAMRIFVGGGHQDDLDAPGVIRLGHTIGTAAAEVSALLA